MTIPIEIIYALGALIIGGIIVFALVYHVRKVDKVRKQAVLETEERLYDRLFPKIEGNKLWVDGKVLELRKYQRAQEYDLVNKAIIGKDDVFEAWKEKTIDQLKKDIVRELPFKVEDERVGESNVRKLTITTYLGVDR